MLLKHGAMVIVCKGVTDRIRGQMFQYFRMLPCYGEAMENGLISFDGSMEVVILLQFYQSRDRRTIRPENVANGRGVPYSLGSYATNMNPVL